MKTYTVGIVAAAVLMIAAGVGFGIAQAAGNQSDSPVWSTQDPMETANLATSDEYSPFDKPEAYLTREEGWSEEDGSTIVYVADLGETGNLSESTQVAQSPQVMGPAETGGLPDQSDMNDLDHSNVPTEGNIHQYWGSDNPSN